MNKKGQVLIVVVGIMVLALIIGGIWYFYFKDRVTSIKCGDGICGPFEKQENICPKDCGTLANQTERCSLGFVFNRTTKTCQSKSLVYTCSEGTYNNETGLCEVQPPLSNICSQGLYNSQTGLCEVQPEYVYICSEGELQEIDGEKRCLIKVSETIINNSPSNNIPLGNKLALTNTYDVTPAVLSLPWRTEIQRIGDKFYVMFNKDKVGIGGFALIVLDNNFKQINYLDMHSGDSNYDPTDLRTFKDDKGHLFYAFENSIKTANHALITKDCKFNKDGIVIYDAASLSLLKNNGEILWGCVKNLDTTQVLAPKDFYNKEASDDPTPFYYNGKYYVLNRAAGGPLMNIREFNSNLVETNHKTINMTPYISNLAGSTNTISQNTVVEINGKLYLIAGVYGTSTLYAFQLSSDFSSVIGEPIKLVNYAGEGDTGPRSSRYSNGILYVTYAAYVSQQLKGVYLEAFDSANNFASLGRVLVSDETKMPEVSLEVSDNKAYVSYSLNLPGKILISRFEWE